MRQGFDRVKARQLPRLFLVGNYQTPIVHRSVKHADDFDSLLVNSVENQVVAMNAAVDAGCFMMWDRRKRLGHFPATPCIFLEFRECS
jgi:hypothetical protein